VGSSFREAVASLQRLHVILDSPAQFYLTKTELDMGMLSQPYEDIAQCVRAAFCVSHSLRQDVRLTICFDELGPLSLHLNPQTIRFMGTDERSILQIVLRAQEASQAPKKDRLVPAGVHMNAIDAQSTVAELLNSETLLLLPGLKATWQEFAATPLTMYCSLSEPKENPWLRQFPCQYYEAAPKSDLAILQILHTLDAASGAMEKD
jgi:hypothetical protein